MERGKPKGVGIWARALAASLALLALTSPAARAAGVQVEFETESSTVEIGETFDVAILASISHPLLGFGFDLDFNDQLFSLDSMVAGGDFFAAKNAGKGFLSAVAFPAAVSGKDVLLGTATFTALAPGTGSFGLSVDSADLTRGFAGRQVGAFLDYSIGALDVTVLPALDDGNTGGGGGGGGPPTPEPSTLALLAIGALTFGRRR